MIYILTVSDLQIKTAIDLYKIIESEYISDEQAREAYVLYNGLHKKPDFRNISVLEEPSSFIFFKEYQRIKFLRVWIVEILPYIDLLSGVGKLPLTRTCNDFEGYINGVFSDFLEELRNISNKIPAEYNLFKKNNFRQIEYLCESLLRSIEMYYKGFPAKAFNELRDGIIDNLSKEGRLDDFLKFPSETSEEKYYKMRVGTDHTFKKEEMFHIPFELRGKVATNRYSIPGIPCIYLGTSPLACWEELNKPELNTVQTSLFQTQSCTYLDLSTPPAIFIENIIHNYGILSKNLFKDICTYILVWPLKAACSIRVKYKDDTFKPEYIIPQLLLQFIRQVDAIDGISYFSTKIDNYSLEISEVYRNFAFPAQEKQKEGLCPKLKQMFEATDAVPWQTFELYKDSGHCVPLNAEEDKRYDVEFINGMRLLYTTTDFYKLENLLKRKSVLEKNLAK